MGYGFTPNSFTCSSIIESVEWDKVKSQEVIPDSRDVTAEIQTSSRDVSPDMVASSVDISAQYRQAMSLQIGILKIVDNTPGAGWFTSLALDSSDHPHISYQVESNENPEILKYAYWDGSIWNIDSIDSDYAGRYSSISLANNGYPHIAYGSSEDLKYCFWDGSEWQIQIIDNKAGFHPISLRLGENGNPHISYCTVDAGYSPDDLKYAYWDGSNWQIEVVDSIGAVGYGASLDLDSSGNPHISYVDISNYIIKYAFYNGDSWIIQNLDSSSDYGVRTVIHLDTSEIVHVIYMDSAFSMKYARFAGSIWQIESIVDDEIGWHPSFSLDMNQSPKICWKSNEIRYFNMHESTWQSENVTIGSHCSLGLDSIDRPHIGSWFPDDRLARR